MRKIIIAAMVLLFSSCGIYTKYTRPTDVQSLSEDIYRGAALQQADSLNNLANLSWREFFQDPCLQRLIDSALVNNTDLRVARLRVAEAEAAFKSAKLAYIPTFGFAPNGAVSSFDGSKGVYAYSVPITASWQIDAFGSVTNAKRRAKAALEGSEAYSRAVTAQIVSAVANSYYTLLMLDSQLDIARRTADSWRENVETMRLLKDAGMGNEASVRQMEANYYSVSTMVRDFEEQVFVVENSISILLAQSPRAIERTKLSEQKMPETLYTGVPVALLSNRPDIQAAESALMQAFYTVGASRAALYPAINLSGSLGWTNSVGSAIINPGSLLASAAASLFEPIFQGGQLRARLKIAKLQAQEAALQFKQAILNAGNEVNTSLEQCVTAKEKSTLITSQVEALKAAAESTELLMQHGSATYLEVLVARQALLGAELSQAQNHLAEIQGVINLYISLGGGYK